MSHVCNVDLRIKDLSALAMTADAIGLELVRGQTHYNCYADHSPAYRVSADDGKCDHALRIKNTPSAGGVHEIGVIKQPDGSYALKWDPMGGIVDMVGGRGAQKLRQGYASAVAKKWCLNHGFRVGAPKVTANGKIVMTVEK